MAVECQDCGRVLCYVSLLAQSEAEWSGPYLIMFEDRRSPGEGERHFGQPFGFVNGAGEFTTTAGKKRTRDRELLICGGHRTPRRIPLRHDKLVGKIISAQNATASSILV